MVGGGELVCMLPTIMIDVKNIQNSTIIIDSAANIVNGSSSVITTERSSKISARCAAN
jgi:hypothetical protein